MRQLPDLAYRGLNLQANVLPVTDVLPVKSHLFQSDAVSDVKFPKMPVDYMDHIPDPQTASVG